MSPSALRKKFLPRRRDTKSPAAHQAAAPQAARAQVQHHQAPSRDERKTKHATTTNRDVGMRRFKPGFELDTEKELSIAFKRPMRTFKDDTPFYPWLPPEPTVNFHLNFHF
nr:MAG: hypothetical protein [Gammatorquevirus sp.]